MPKRLFDENGYYTNDASKVIDKYKRILTSTIKEDYKKYQGIDLQVIIGNVIALEITMNRIKNTKD